MPVIPLKEAARRLGTTTADIRRRFPVLRHCGSEYVLESLIDAAS